MSTNLYNEANGLEKALRESTEYQELRALYDQVNADEAAKNMFDNFRDIQLKLQQKQMAGEEISQEEVDQAQKSVALVQQNPTIAKLMEAEQRMSMIIAELNKIIMKPLEELYGAVE
ncbi:YlbF family regulator [Metabacillus sp. 84]|uniref:YlbF family regulator n=1 Tax=unclassified Metabacillus TaxID=2675274 RepID=UPI003CEC6D93